MKPAQEQLEYITQSVEVSLPEGALLALIEEDRPLRVKLGVDPTAPDVTLGWAVVFDLLRRFQNMGHTAVLIVGDFTAQVGDPSEKSATRKRLSADEMKLRELIEAGRVNYVPLTVERIGIAEEVETWE